MGFFRLPKVSVGVISHAPEVKMDVHVAKDITGAFVLVVAERVMLTIDENVPEQLSQLHRIMDRGEGTITKVVPLADE